MAIKIKGKSSLKVARTIRCLGSCSRIARCLPRRRMSDFSFLSDSIWCWVGFTPFCIVFFLLLIFSHVVIVGLAAPLINAFFLISIPVRSIVFSPAQGKGFPFVFVVFSPGFVGVFYCLLGTIVGTIFSTAAHPKGVETIMVSAVLFAGV